MRKLSPRGFAIYLEMQHSYRGKVTLKESSNASYPAVWLNIDNSQAPGFNLPSSAGSAHLTIEQVRELRDALNEFLSES